MLKISVIVLALTSFFSHVTAQCISNLEDILSVEEVVTNIDVKRTYTLCPKTVFKPTVLNRQTGLFPNNKTPLSFKANVEIKCGANGSAKNNCVIDGTGTYGLFLDPFRLFGTRPDLGVVILQGITFDYFVRDNQIPIVILAETVDFTFLDCIFSNNQADPIFYIDQLFFDQFSRSSVIEDGSDVGATEGSPKWYMYDPGRTRRRLDIHIPEGEHEANSTFMASFDRKLQTSAEPAFRVTFDGCLFDVSTISLLI